MLSSIPHVFYSFWSPYVFALAMTFMLFFTCIAYGQRKLDDGTLALLSAVAMLFVTFHGIYRDMKFDEYAHVKMLGGTGGNSFGELVFSVVLTLIVIGFTVYVMRNKIDVLGGTVFLASVMIALACLAWETMFFNFSYRFGIGTLSATDTADALALTYAFFEIAGVATLVIGGIVALVRYIRRSRSRRQLTVVPSV